MATMTVGDIYRCVVYCREDSQLGLNVSHFRVTSVVPDGVTELFVANFLSALFKPLYAVALNAVATFRGVSIQRVSPTPVADIIYSALATGTVSGSGDSMSPQTAGVIKLTTGLAGRRYRGRKYIPFPGEDRNTLGYPTSAYVGSLAAIGAAYLALHTPADGGGGVGLYFGLRTDATTGFISFNGATPRNAWGTQRRRSFIGPGDAFVGP